jgi:uncharacterized protein
MIKIITKISFTTLLLLSLTACNDTKKEENEFKASLPIPEWDEKVASTVDGYIGNWHDAKKDPISATKIGYTYSEELKDYEKALEWYKYSDSMKSLPENSNYACYVFQQLKKYDEAIFWCQKAIELGNTDALIGLGYNYSKLENYKDALKWYLEASKKNHPDAFINLGTTYFNLDDYENSEKYYKEAIKNNDYQAYQGIAKLFHDKIKDDTKASAYAIAMINTKYTKSSVLGLLKNDWNISDDIIKKGYELQLNSPDFLIKYKGKL